MTTFADMHLAESALSVVLSKWGVTAIAQRNKLQRRLDEIKELHPHLFLTDRDIDQSSGAFMFHLDERGTFDGHYQRVLFKGRDTEGNYKWGPSDRYTDLHLVASEFGRAVDEDGNVTFSESEMTWLLVLPNPCTGGIYGGCDGESCLICTPQGSSPLDSDFDEESDSEIAS